MGPPENPTSHPEKQEARRGGNGRRAGRGPGGVCSKDASSAFGHDRRGSAIAATECRKAARAWSRWKAQQSYRATAAGKQKRNGQSRRYRERVKEPKTTRERGRSGGREGHH